MSTKVASSQPGIDEPIAMAQSAPGVIDLIKVFNQYTEFLRMLSAYQQRPESRIPAASSGAALSSSNPDWMRPNDARSSKPGSPLTCA